MSSYYIPNPEGHDNDRYFYKNVDDYNFIMDILTGLELEVGGYDPSECHSISVSEIYIEFLINNIYRFYIEEPMDPDGFDASGGYCYIDQDHLDYYLQDINNFIDSVAVGDTITITFTNHIEYRDEYDEYVDDEKVSSSISFTVTTENPTAFKRLAIVPYATYTGKWKQGVTKNDITTLLIGGDDLAGYITLEQSLGDHPIKEISYINNSIPVFYDYPYDDPDERGDEFVYGGNIELNGTAYSKWHRSGRGEDRLFYLTPNLVDCEEVWPWKSWVTDPSDIHMYYRLYHEEGNQHAGDDGWYIHGQGDSPIVVIGSENGKPCFWVGPNDPDDPDYGKPDTKYKYLGQETFNGTLYDKWDYSFGDPITRIAYTNIVANYVPIQAESAINDSLNRNIDETYLRRDSTEVSSFDGTYANMSSIGKSKLRSWVVVLTGTFYHPDDEDTYSYTLTTSYLSNTNYAKSWTNLRPLLIRRPCTFSFSRSANDIYDGVINYGSSDNTLGIVLGVDDDATYSWNLSVNTSSISQTSYEVEE